METLKRLLGVNSPSGDEESIRGFITDETKRFGFEAKTDALGNLIVHKPGSGSKIMLAAHMDEIGIIVTFIDEKGFLRFGSVGYLYTKELNHRRVVFKNGVTGVISLEENEKEPSLDKMFIDIGASSREDAEKLVSVGDTAAFCGDAAINGSVIISKALDNRAGCFILLELMEHAAKSDKDIYFVFTVQEEVGLRGAKTAAFGVNPDFALAVDVTDTGDTPNCRDMAVRMGGGAAIKVMDHSVMCHPEVREKLVRAARENNIPYQLEIMTDGGTDAGAIHLSGTGVRTGGVSIPVRYIHSPSEMADLKDIEACIKLIKAFIDII